MKWFLTKQDPALPNHEQWLSKSMLWKYLREVKRMKHHLLDSKTVSPTYTYACEYLFLNIDKMPGSSGGRKKRREAAAGSRWLFWGPGIVLLVRRLWTAVKHSHLPARGSPGLGSQLFSRPQVQFCSMKTWPNPFQWNFYLHPWVTNDTVYQWSAFILDVFKHRREDCSTLVIVSQPRWTEFHPRIREDCMVCRGLAMFPATLQYVGIWLQCIPYQNTRGRHFKIYLQKASVFVSIWIAMYFVPDSALSDSCIEVDFKELQ